MSPPKNRGSFLGRAENRPLSKVAIAPSVTRPHPAISISIPLRFFIVLYYFQLSDIIYIRFQRLTPPPLRIKFFITLMRQLDHAVMTDTTIPLEQGPLVELQKIVHVLAPVEQGDVFPLLGAIFCIVQEHGGDAIELLYLVALQIILGDDHIGFTYAPTFPGLQSHVGLTRISTFGD